MQTQIIKACVMLMASVGLMACASNAPHDSASAAVIVPATTPDSLGKRVGVPPELLNAGIVRSDAPSDYVVKKGDTLWDISAHFLNSPWLWPEIWYVNPQIHNPHLIYPGDVVSLRWINGRPVLSVNGKLSPQLRAQSDEAPIATLPMDAIRDFVDHLRLMDEATYLAAPYVLNPVDGHLLAGNDMQVFARNLPNNPVANWQVWRAGQAYYDPDTGALLGHEMTVVADAVVRQAGDPTRLAIQRANREVIQGDRLFPPTQLALPSIMPLQAVANGHEGRVVAGFDGSNISGKYQIIALNRGSLHGVQAGSTYDIYSPDQVIEDPVVSTAENPQWVTVPGLRRAAAVAFLVDASFSYAIVMQSDGEVRPGDFARSPLLADAER